MGRKKSLVGIHRPLIALYEFTPS